MQQLGKKTETISSSGPIFITHIPVFICFYYEEVQGKCWEGAEGNTEHPHHQAPVGQMFLPLSVIHSNMSPPRGLGGKGKHSHLVFTAGVNSLICTFPKR